MTYKHQVDSIHIYPIKGFAPHTVSEAFASPIGFDGDRRYMLVDSDNKFVTARTLPQLLQCKADITESHITLEILNRKCTFDLSTDDPSFVAQIWDDTAMVQTVNPDIDVWLSAQLDRTIRLVRMANESARVHASKYTDASLNVTLADGYPFQIIGSESVRHLAELRQHTVNPLRFRPNIIVSTAVPHEEDSWSTVRIGDVVLEKVKNCVRCNIINIDPATGMADPSISKTLANYRNLNNNGIEFGVYFKVRNPGVIRQDAEVVVDFNMMVFESFI